VNPVSNTKSNGWLEAGADEDQTDDSENMNLVADFVVDDSDSETPDITKREAALGQQLAPAMDNDSDSDWFMPPK